MSSFPARTDRTSAIASSERGHNAAGSWAIIAMLVLVSVQAGTGLFIADRDEFIEGALYGVAGSDTTQLLYRIHKTNASVLQGLVIVHVAMVFIYLLYGRLNLIKPMIVGYLQWPAHRSIPEVRWRPAYWGALCLLASLALVGWLVGWY